MRILQNIIKKYTSQENISLIFEFFDKHHVNCLKFSDEKEMPLKLCAKNFIGGNDDSKFIDVYLNKNIYCIRAYKYIEHDNKNLRTITFIKIKSKLQETGDFGNVDQCAILIIDTEINESNIQSINNYDDCIKCHSDKDKLYKVGDILIQSMILMSINKGIKKINLHDNSYYKCNKYNIPLINLRTITH